MPLTLSISSQIGAHEIRRHVICTNIVRLLYESACHAVVIKLQYYAKNALLSLKLTNYVTLLPKGEAHELQKTIS